MIRYLVFGLAGIAMSAVGHAQETSSLHIKTSDAVHQLNIELANTPDIITIGLSDRETLAPDTGMLFDFGESRITSKSMKGVSIPLDMIFINSVGTVMAITRNAVPHSERQITIGTPMRAVLELNADAAKTLGIQPGDTVIHPLFNNTDTLDAPAE